LMHQEEINDPYFRVLVKKLIHNIPFDLILFENYILQKGIKARQSYRYNNFKIIKFTNKKKFFIIYRCLNNEKRAKFRDVRSIKTNSN